MFGLQLHSNSVKSELSHAAQSVLELERDVLVCVNEKDFFARHHLKYAELHKQSHMAIDGIVPELESL